MKYRDEESESELSPEDGIKQGNLGKVENIDEMSDFEGDEELPDFHDNVKLYEDHETADDMDPNEPGFLPDDAKLIDYDIQKAIKYMDEKDVTEDFICMKNEAKLEFFDLETEYPTKYFSLKNGEVIGYRHCGNTELNSTKVLLIHGNDTCGLQWEKLMKRFVRGNPQKQEYELYAPCLRGFGTTTCVNELHSCQDIVDDLRIFMDECVNCQEFYIICHSISGLFGMMMALTLGEKCLGLVLLNSIPAQGWQHLQVQKINTIQELKKIPFVNFRYTMVTYKDFNLYSAYFAGTNPRTLNADKEKSQRALLIMSRQRMFLDFELLAYYKTDIQKEVCNINCPVLILSSLKDYIMTTEQAIQIQTDIGKNAELIALSKCDHFVHVKRPKLIHRLIKKFLDQHEAVRIKLKPKPKYEGKEEWYGRFNERFIKLVSKDFTKEKAEKKAEKLKAKQKEAEEDEEEYSVDSFCIAEEDKEFNPNIGKKDRKKRQEEYESEELSEDA